MTYTVKELAEISGVTVRTLHWYDEIGLLKPAYCGVNGYRYYEEEQLLILQQILFFRELGFKLGDIQKVLTSSVFDKIGALHTHKRYLENSFNRTKQLIETINKTIAHLKGEKKMQNKELYAGFDWKNKKEHEVYLAQSQGTIAEEIVAKSVKNTKDWSDSDWKDMEREMHGIYAAVAKCMDENLEAKSDQVQSLIAKHCQESTRVHQMTKDVYLSLAQLYCEHPDFQTWFSKHYPSLPEFLAEAMRVYAHHQLT